MSKVDGEARCQFSVKRFPWQNTGENCDERSSFDERFLAKLLCNSNGRESESNTFRRIIRLKGLSPPPFFYEVSFVNNFVDFCFKRA